MTEDKQRRVAAACARQWGLITSAQIEMLGLNRQDTKRMREAGLLITLQRGLYRHHSVTETVPTVLSDARCAWLLTRPAMWGEDRLALPAPDAVLTATTALTLHGITPDAGVVVPEIAMNTQRSYRSTARILAPPDRLDWAQAQVIDGLPIARPIPALAAVIAAASADHRNPRSAELTSFVAAAVARICDDAADRPEGDAVIGQVAGVVGRRSTQVVDVAQMLATLCREAGVSEDILAQTVLVGRWNLAVPVDRTRQAVAAVLAAAFTAPSVSLPVVLADLFSVDPHQLGQVWRCAHRGCPDRATGSGYCSRHRVLEVRDRTTRPVADGDEIARSGFGIYGRLDDDGHTVLCHECGRRLRHINARHLAGHDMTAAEYRVAHGISPRVGLISGDSHRRRAQNSFDQGRPDLLRHLRPTAAQRRPPPD
ncbi:MucR family transcriptional regulator [Gordonia aquimaris]|uniref:MucR family transcriptional regulator n=1 Tax=Gordonia aquimaris TaxID=2984863 RepID=A0A9X3D9I6_9ACTN|nr:MucR family transcriptional regulator [Gordonia aquimaris]MCX2966196.1 MucR family transcriptional regulator [Gordonia aquimaris]